jgi:tetratricopeptide (TPR) repeat protein
MTSPTRKNNDDDRRSPSLWNYLLTVLVSAATGAGLTWLITSQRSEQGFHSSVIAPTPSNNALAPDVSGLSPGEAAVRVGNFAYDHQRWPEAIRKYEEAIASGVNTADVHTDLGNAFRFSGQPDQALNQYTIAQKLDPQHENSLFNQISLFVEVLNEPLRAIPICEEFIRRFPASDKLPAVKEQLARANGTSERNPKSDGEMRATLSHWLRDQQKQSPAPSPLRQP